MSKTSDAEYTSTHEELREQHRMYLESILQLKYGIERLQYHIKVAEDPKKSFKDFAKYKYIIKETIKKL